MANDDSKIRNGKATALLFLLLLTLLGAVIWWAIMADRRKAEALKPTVNATLLPIIAGPFKQDGIIAYELKHGWLVREAGGISSLTFVPKSSK